MALPKLNTVSYDLELPSTGETVKFRPFLVKEQKNLLIAQESEDDKVIENAFAQIITDCTNGEIDPYQYPLFDIEYLFLQMRAKSVGEKSTIMMTAEDDGETKVPVEIDLSKVSVKTEVGHSNEVQLTDDIRMVMGYPTLSDMAIPNEAKTEVERIFVMIKRCVMEIHDGEEIHNRVDISDKELDEFLENMSTEMFEKLSAFFETMPKLKHAVKFTNPKTKAKNEVNIEGLQSFFE